MAVYMTFLLWQSNANLIWLYPVKTFAVAATLWLFRKHYPELQSGLSWLAVGIGLAAIAIWIAGERSRNLARAGRTRRMGRAVEAVSRIGECVGVVAG